MITELKVGHLNLTRVVDFKGVQSTMVDIDVNDGETAMRLVEAALYALYKHTLDVLQDEKCRQKAYEMEGVKDDVELANIVLNRCFQNALALTEANSADITQEVSQEHFEKEELN